MILGPALLDVSPDGIPNSFKKKSRIFGNFFQYFFRIIDTLTIVLREGLSIQGLFGSAMRRVEQVAARRVHE